VTDPGIVCVEGGFVGEGDVLIAGGLGWIAGRNVLCTGGGERAQGAKVAGVVGEGALRADGFGDLGCLRG
jgi:hypothetical protein